MICSSFLPGPAVLSTLQILARARLTMLSTRGNDRRKKVVLSPRQSWVLCGKWRVGYLGCASAGRRGTKRATALGGYGPGGPKWRSSERILKPSLLLNERGNGVACDGHVVDLASKPFCLPVVSFCWRRSRLRTLGLKRVYFFAINYIGGVTTLFEILVVIIYCRVTRLNPRKNKAAGWK